MRLALRETMIGFRRAPVLSVLSITTIAFSLFAFGLFSLVAVNIRKTLSRRRVARGDPRIPVGRHASRGRVGRDGRHRRVSRGESRRVRLAGLGAGTCARGARRVQGRIRERVPPGVHRRPAPRGSPRSRDGPHRRGSHQVAASSSTTCATARTGSTSSIASATSRRRRARCSGSRSPRSPMIIIGATIRMAVIARAREISIMRLVGATDGFIRRPFLIEGFVKGVLGGSLALALTWFASVVISRNFIETEFFSRGARRARPARRRAHRPAGQLALRRPPPAARSDAARDVRGTRGAAAAFAWPHARAQPAAAARGEAKIRQQREELERIRREREELQRSMSELQTKAHDLNEEVTNLHQQADATARVVRSLDVQLETITTEVDGTTGEPAPRRGRAGDEEGGAAPPADRHLQARADVHDGGAARGADVRPAARRATNTCTSWRGATGRSSRASRTSTTRSRSSGSSSSGSATSSSAAARKSATRRSACARSRVAVART